MTINKNLLFTTLFAVLINISCKNESSEKVAQVKSIDQALNQEENQSNDKKYRYVAALSGMNMRSSPDLKGEIIQLVKYNDKLEFQEKTGIKLEVEGIEGEWVKVKNQMQEGYVFGGFLLDFELPTLDPSVGIENYLSMYYKATEPKKAFAVRMDTNTSEAIYSPVALEDVQINEENESFELIQKYEGDRVYKELIGYESSHKTIFIPNIGMREGFLLLKGILPYHTVYDELCGLELKKVAFPKKSFQLKVKDNCVFEITVDRENGEVTFIQILNEEYAYTGLSVQKVDGGIEISQFLSL